MLNKCRPVRPLLIALLSASLLVAPVQKASADLIEYALVVALIAFAATVGSKLDLPPGSVFVLRQLRTAVEGARAANIVGDPAAEHSRLSKAAGATEALLGMTADCEDCSQLQDTLQQILGHVALLKTSIVGVSGTCNPNGIVQRNEQCDPLAIPSGCPTTRGGVTYCSDECRCETSIVP